ncbi:MAG TPA: PaaI family thioesterase [Myxococcaceae bacterium]|nr:PaaI family thioesterase [Myxococcaceae bacterium]
METQPTSPPDAERQAFYEALMKILPLAPINKLYQPRNLVVRKGEASLEMPVLEAFYNGGHLLHGSAYFKGLDETAWFAANSLAGQFALATTSFNTYILRSVRKGNLQVRARVISATQNLVIVESDMFNDSDTLVARGSGTFQPTQIPISILLTAKPPSP